MNSPVISVILPVYNGAKYLEEAIESVLSQDFTDFELLVLNDGSTDNSLAVAQRFADPRIRILHSEKNLGLVSQLNIGIKNAKGEYLARIDQDDTCRPDRLRMQYEFMKTNADIGLCGSFANCINPGREGISMPRTHEEIRIHLLEFNAFIHSSVMVRKSVLDEHHLWYDDDFRSAEDYHLWIRMSRITNTANLPENLVNYRYHQEQISKKDNSTQNTSADKVRFLQVEELIGRGLNEAEKRIHKQLIFGLNPEQSPDDLVEWATELKSANRKKRIYDLNTLENWLDRRLKRELSRYFLWNAPAKHFLGHFFFSGKLYFLRFGFRDVMSIMKKNLLPII